MSLFEKWGHFSQIVWKGTTHVGCYTAHCPNGLGNVGSDVSPYFTVCNYKNPGKKLLQVNLALKQAADFLNRQLRWRVRRQCSQAPRQGHGQLEHRHVFVDAAHSSRAFSHGPRVTIFAAAYRT